MMLLWLALQDTVAEAKPYKIDDGPHKVTFTKTFKLHDDARGKDVPVNAWVPDGDGPFPVIIFSHGAGGAGSNEFPVTRHWATHGYVVVQPTHADSRSLNGGELKRTDDGPAQRALDVKFVIDSLEKVEDFKGKLDLKRIGVGGHSFGAHTSMLIGGATVDVKGEAKSYADERPKALLLLSGQGAGMLGLTEKSWDACKRPMMAMTGSKDLGVAGQTPAQKLEAFTRSPEGDKYGVDIEGASHMSFTGRLADREPEIFSYVKTASIAFWDAYINEEPAAKDFLKSDALKTLSKDAVKLQRR